MRGQPGSICRIGIDSWNGLLPDEGDFLRTPRGSCYRIEEIKVARPGSKRIATVVCTRLEHDAVAHGEPGVHGLVFNRRS